MSTSHFKITFDSDDENKKVYLSNESNEEEDDDDDYAQDRKYRPNIFADDETTKKITNLKTTARAADPIKKEETTDNKSNRYSSIILKNHLNADDHKVKENSRSNSASSANNNDTLKIHDDYASYSTTKNIVPPPQIGALRFNPAKIIEDSVRKNSNNNNNQSRSSTNNDSYYKDRNSTFNSDDSLLNSSEKTQKTLLRENLELKTTISKMTAELKYTNLKITDKPDCKLTIENFISNKNYTFDIYKNKRDKIKLLNEAISSHDGNAILAVVLFLKNSLFPEIFYGILISNPTALNQYVFYLEQMKYYSELADFYKFQGNSTESSTIKYFRPIFSKNNKELNEKIYLDDFEKKSTVTELRLVENSSIITPVRKYITLLSIQKEITNKNKSIFLRKDEVRQNAMDTLYKSSVSNTISFCLKYNKDLNENPIYSIENLKKEFDIQTKQFSIWFIKSMSEIGAWSALENYTKQRGIFNMVKSPPISFETIVFIISKQKGPPEQIKKYLSLVEDIERRQALAIKFKITDVVLETYKIQKDRVGLLNFRNTFREGSNDYIKANILIADDKIKWKN